MHLIYKLMGKETSVELTNYLTLGRERHCGVVIPDPNIDERHCRFEQKGDYWIVRDISSGLGVFINQSKVIEGFINAGDQIRLGQFTLRVAESPDEQFAFPLSSKNKIWNEQLAALGQVAQTNYPIMLLGPTGSGKDVLARAIHESSTRRRGPFIGVNCSALTETLIESELFGHVKGSFTGAITDRKGAFESARGGTLFLDELGDLPFKLQAKILRAIENCEIRPVGSDSIVKTDVRIITATHQDLRAKIIAREFREDLYYRLNVVTVSSPPLCDRMEDFEHLLYTFAREFRVRFSHDAIQKLKNYEWPGNIRELRNVVMRAAALYAGKSVEEEHIESLVLMPPKDQSLEMPKGTPKLSVIKEMEKQVIIRALTSHHGNQRRAAAALGMPKSTLHDRVKTYQIDLEQFKFSAPG